LSCFPGQRAYGQPTILPTAKASDDQRRALEAVFTGNKGGLFEGLMSGVISTWLPPRTVPIEIRGGDQLSVAVGEFGNATIEPFKDQAGNHASVQGTAARALFQSASMNIASSRGTRSSDPELKQWEGDSATIHKVEWGS
jgi:hypothetical protein